MKSRALSALIVGVFFAVCATVIIQGTRKPGGAPASAPAEASSVDLGAPKGAAIDVVISSSDGKKEWLEDVTRAFHASKPDVGGKPIRVSIIHMKSGESLQRILDGKEKPTIWSPAAAPWIDRINTSWKARSGHAFLSSATPTVKSGAVIAMWEPMARSLGWPDKPIGYSDIFKVAMDPKGWASVGHAEWGPFRFGHGHPDFSTSAMMSVVSSIYAAAGKNAGLTPEDLRSPTVVDRVGALERAIVHYGESSSWLTEKLCTKGPAYLSAVTLYESSVVSANEKFAKQMPFKLVAIYPKEGTFWEDHPTGIVDAEWVSAEQREAAAKLIAYMTSKEQEAKAPRYGYRPADTGVAIGAPLDQAHGVDPKQPSESSLEYPNEDVFRRANELWHRVKKHSTVYLVLDTSGSMQGEKMNAAKQGAATFIRAMEKDDQVAVIAFSDAPRLLKPLAMVRDVGEPLAGAVEGLFADGGTALHDATLLALDGIEKAKRDDPGRLYGVVLLTDGQDTSSRRTVSDLLDKMPATETAEGTRIFTVAYGDDADKDLLLRIATRSNARALKGSADDIGKVYHQISAYF